MFALLSKENTKHLTGSLLLISIIVSMACSIPLVASDIPEGNNVSWQSQNETTQNAWDWTNQGWQFGPYPTFAVILPNGTEITDEHYLPLGQIFGVRIDIQKSIFIGNATLGQAGVNWGIDLRSQNGSITGNANCKMMYINNIQQGNNNQTNAWNIFSNINNQTETLNKTPSGPQPQNGFFQFNSQNSNITETPLGWRIVIVGAFNSSAPIGPYWVNLQITDQYNNGIDVNSQTGQASKTNNRQIAVGQAGFVFGGLQDYWTFEKLDMQNNPLMSVSKGAEWKMRLNVTSAQFTNATIGLNLPWNIQQYVNVTGWYQQVTTENGGWMLNETSGTYYWNNTVEVTRNQQVYGPHLEQRWTTLTNTNHEVNKTDNMWNPVTNRNEIVTRKMNIQDQLFLTFNQATHAFDIKIGYCYDSYDPNLQQYANYQVLNPINMSDPSSQFFTLSLADCHFYQTAPNKYTVEFVGSFSNTTNYSQDQYSLQINVFTPTQQICANWEKTNPSDMQIIVDRPVAVSTILDSQGHSASSQSMFMIDQNKPFIVQSKIYGSSATYQSLDAIGVSFYSNFGTWSETQSSNSQVEIRLTKNLNTNQITSTSYNRTNVNRYVYGAHQGWAYVNVTDWHTEYNADSGMWDWIDSPHVIWNQTTLTDWHWEYFRLNQTEYARNPNSPNIWMDTSTCYIDDMDPAFQVSSTYATMDSANLTLANGVVLVNLGVTFTAAAPQGNYWYKMVFQNMTYGQDPSQGWGQHLITEWTNEPTYYINAAATNGQSLLVNTPSNPLYTVYNANRYIVNQVPYMTVAGNDLLIKPQVQYDQSRQQDWTQYLLTGPYDPSIARQTQYYQLLNGTNVYVNQAYQTIIRTLQLTTANAYTVAGTSTIPLPNGTTINTYMNHAVADYSRQFWNQQGNVLPFYYEQLNGSKVYLNTLFENSGFNSTTNHWDLTDQVYLESHNTLLAESIGSGVRLDNTVVLLRNPGNWQALPDGSGYYLVMQNGTRITIRDPFSVPDDQRIATVNGDSYHVSWPNQYFQITYLGQEILIPNGQNNDNFVQSYFYTNLGIEGGTQYELPYPGAMATSWWDLQGIESTGQKLRTLKSISINGLDYILNFDNNTQTYFINIDGLRQTVTYPTNDYSNFYTTINGQASWNITQNGWTIYYGTYRQQSNQINSVGSLVTTTGYDSAQKSWSTPNHYGYDHENSTLYLTMTNGTRLNVDSTMNLIVWKVQVGNQTYYTTENCASQESTLDASSQTVFRNYFHTLNGEKIYFDWDTPANWQQEIHLPITGTNYTRLVPYTWQPQTVFDKIVIYNITIPGITGNATHTGVYYQNGTEIASGTAFKVFGTRYGPGTCYQFNQNGGAYNFDGAYIPMTKAPWDNAVTVSYFITLTGNRIYSLGVFGWNGDINGNPWNSGKQWAFNGDAASANRTVSVVQGGYAVFLNDTIKVDITTQNVCGYSTDNYVVLTNGTRLNVQWINSQSCYFTSLGDQMYLFRYVLSFCNVTDGGVTYSVADPIWFDQRHMYTPSTYQAPTISNDQATWQRMNTTTVTILKDTTGYYIVNASNQSRVDIQLVDAWWNSPSTVRSQVFKDQYSDYYARFNVTINGAEYFVLDPNPVVDRWNDDYSTQSAMYRYDNTMTVTLDNTTYRIVLFQNGASWTGNLTIRLLNSINFNGTQYELDNQYNGKPSYQVNLNGENVPIELDTMNIYKTHESWGNTYTWKLADLGISTTSQVNCLIVGTPQFGMWGIKAYKTVDTTGAVDLDGNTANASDQYFVRKIHSGTDAQTQTTKRMLVQTTWNPDATKVGDEIRLNAWMGQLQVSWTSQWSESYIWYHASDMTPVTNEEMTQIKNTVVNIATQQPNPGYWDISYMVRNQTWADVLAQAQANNWNWINSNTNQWNWLWFGTDQNYNIDVPSGNTVTNAGVDLKYEFAGLNVLNGTQQTHYFMPKDVDNVTFVTPGQAFGNFAPSGNINVPLNSKIDFGVVYNNVNGTLFPYDNQRSMWGWWDRPIYGSDFNSPNLMNKPTAASIDQMEFTVHFAGTQTGAQYNTASMKIDQRIGDWHLPRDVVDGREQNNSGVMVPLVGNDVLDNRSLAINYYVTASTSMGWNVKDASGTSVRNNGVTESSRFDVASQMSDVNFASIKLGSIYDWGKPTTPTDELRTFNVTSQTTAIQNFQSSYQSDAGKSSTGFDISSSMYFLTQGFPRWDGYSIYNDPEVSVLVSRGVTPQNAQPTPQPTSTTTTQSTQSNGQQNSQTSTTNPTPKPSNNKPNPTTPPQGTTPETTPTQQTPQPTVTPPIEIPTTLIVIGICVALGVVIGSVLLVRAKKK